MTAAMLAKLSLSAQHYGPNYLCSWGTYDLRALISYNKILPIKFFIFLGTNWIEAAGSDRRRLAYMHKMNSIFNSTSEDIRCSGKIKAFKLIYACHIENCARTCNTLCPCWYGWLIVCGWRCRWDGVSVISVWVHIHINRWVYNFCYP